MFLRNVKIGTRLGLGFTMILAILVLTSIITIGYMKDLTGLTTKLYEHPLAVSQAILRVEGNVIRMHHYMNNLVHHSRNGLLVNGLQKDEIHAIVTKVNMLEIKILNDFNVIQDRFLGSKAKVEDTKDTFMAWKSIREDAISLVEAGKQQEAVNLITGKGTLYVNDLEKRINEFILFAQGKAGDFLEEAVQSRNQALWITYASLLGTGGIVAFFAFFFTRSIKVPLLEVVQISDELAKGNLSKKIHVEGNDEVSDLLNAMKNLAHQLLEMTQKNEQKDWLKSGRNELNEKTRGETHEKNLAQNIITFLAKYLDAQMGAFYIMNEQGNELHLLGSYAFIQDSHFNNTIKMGEGLVGQAAFDKEMISITDLPDTYVHIGSGTGNEIPRNIVLAPVAFGERLTGVIELGAFQKFSDLQIEFLSSITESTAIAINMAQARTIMKKLLEKTQQQSEELQTQNEELESQQEELQTQNEELESQQEELRVANEVLEKKQEEVKKQNQILQQARKELELKANALEISGRYKSEFLANMSHELRTPLNSILLLSELLRENNEGNLSDKQVEYAAMIHSSGSDLLDLINNVLDLAKIEAGKVELHADDVYVEDIAQNIRQIFQTQVENKGLTLHIEIEKKLPALIRTDPQRLVQILKNFFSNALKFTTEGAITFSIHRLDQETASASNNRQILETSIAFSVADTGIGIPADKLQLIFNAFEQIDGGLNRKYEGTGLGLSICKEMAALLGGFISVQSQEGKGSAFSLHLPEKIGHPIFDNQPQEESIPSVSNDSNAKQEEKSLNKPVTTEDIKQAFQRIESVTNKTINHVLIVEDDEATRMALAELIKSNHVQISAMGRGQDAYDFLMNHECDCMVLDLNLEDMSGQELLKRIEKEENLVFPPVIIYTAKDISIEEERQLEQYTDSIVIKNPQSKERLLSEITLFLHHMEKETPPTKGPVQQILYNKDEILDKKTILLVDDDARNVYALSSVLEDNGIQVLKAFDGKSALELLEASPYVHLVLMDIMMPEIDGYACITEIRKNEHFSKLPIIAVTAKAMKGDRMKCLEAGADDYISKPVDTQKLLSLLRIWLDQ
ncbi:MAG: response regulator [SAR324 cluster bacterium]|nr:response regulator [SAR324 cluster bacterium]